MTPPPLATLQKMPMPTNPFEPPKEVGKPIDWFRTVSMLISALALLFMVGLLAFVAFAAVADSIPPR